MKYTNYLFVLLLFSIGLNPLTNAQISYNVEYHSQDGNPGGLNTESDFSLIGWDTVLTGGLIANQWSGIETLPFPFQFFGTSVDHFKVSANGLLTFQTSATAIPGNNMNIPTSQLPAMTVSCFWENFAATPPTGTNDIVVTKTFGTAPNRQHWIRWNSFEWGTSVFTFVSIVLEESSQNVYLVDMYGNSSNTSLTTTVGLQKNSSFAVQSGSSNTPLSGAGSSNTDNSYYEFVPFTILPFDLVPVSIESPTSDACGLGMEPVSIRLTNIGMNSASGMTAFFSVDGGPNSPAETLPGTLVAGDTMDYTFSHLANLSATGLHEILVTLHLAGDGDNTNDTISGRLTNLLEISSFPYTEDFEGGNGGWNAEGTNSSWELGTPANDTISSAASGSLAWITGRTGPHNSNERSFVVSPCFDLTSAGSKATIALNIWWESEYGWDGAVLQASSDGGATWTRIGNVGDPSNWYNSSIASQPGNQVVGWSGKVHDGKGSGGWVRASHALGPQWAGKSSVKFRIAFASNGAVHEDGFAFDDFVIGTPPSVNVGPNGFYCKDHTLDAGNPGATYLWSNGSTNQTLSLKNNSANDILDSLVTVTVTNSLGLATTDSIYFSMASPMVASTIHVVPAGCAGGFSGEIDISMTGGSTPYSYLWSNGMTDQDPSGLSAGTYFCTITDANGCTTTTDSLFVSENAALSVVDSVTAISCYGETDGAILLSIAGGSGNYEYAWSTGDSTNYLSNLSAGTYEITVSDDEDCSSDYSITLQAPDSLTTQIDSLIQPSCIDAMDGQLFYSALGGTAPFIFNWDQGQIGPNPSNLAPGVYAGTVIDAHGCGTTIAPITLFYTDTIPSAGFSYNQEGGYIGFTDSSQNGRTWFWEFGDGTTSTQQNPVHLYEYNGIFTVKQTVSSACGSDTTFQEVNMIASGIAQDLENSNLKVFPNPASGYIQIENNQIPLENVQITLYNLTGSIVINEARAFLPAEGQVKIDLTPVISQGLYVLLIESGDQRYYQRLEIQK